MKKLWLRFRTLTWKHLLAVSFLAIVLWVATATVTPFANVLAGWLNSPDRTFTALAVSTNAVYKSMLSNDLDLLRNKGSYLDLNGLMARLMGQRDVNKVVRLNNGYLSEVVTMRYDIPKIAANVLAVDALLREREIPLLYVNAPGEVCKHTAEQQLPAGIVDYSNDNADALLEYLTSSGIASLDLREELPAHGMDCYQALYRTDHHWTFEASLLSAHIILEHLSSQGYTDEADAALYDMANCRIEEYPQIFLGSMGKRVGQYYSGLDDISLIIPEVDMAFEVIAPEKNMHLTGSFEEVFIDREAIEPVDLYGKSPYCAYYTGFDMQIINHNAACGDTLLLIGDSYNVPIRTFFALHYKQVIFLYRPKLSTMQAAIEEYNPDVAVALYYRGAPDNRN